MHLKVLQETTPARISKEIEQFCESVSPGERPVFVPVRPQPHAIVDGCHVNVGEHVRSYAGKPVFGWLIWQSPALLHGLFHCIWQSPEGELVDITPQADGERKVLFLPDFHVNWSGRLIPAKRQPRLNDPRLFQFVKVYEQKDRIGAKYKYGESFSPFDSRRILHLEMEITFLALDIESAWRKGSAPASRSVADRRARRKAERRRRKQQRRRK